MESCDSRSALRKPLSRSANRIEAECARSIGEAPNEWELMMQIGEPLRTIIVETGIRASEANPETGRPRGGHWSWDRHREDDPRGAGLRCAFQPDGSGDWTQADRLGRSQHALGGELLGRVANRSSGMTSGCKQIKQEG